MPPKTLRIFYWMFTLLFVLPQAWSASQMLIEAPRMTETITELGYPVYFMKILGVAKLLGIAAILYGGFPVLKEWAYAGFTFDLVGAFVSHLAVGDPLTTALIPVGFLALLLVSYATWRRPARRQPTDR
jgi:hypothetical protein